MKTVRKTLHVRITAVFLTLICLLGLVPASVFAVSDVIKLDHFGYSGVTYESEKLGRCLIHQMYVRFVP